MSVEEERRKAALAAEARARGMEPWQLEMSKAVDDKLMREIVNDQRRGVSQPSSMIPEPPKGEPKPKGSGWVEPRPLESPPGVAILDKIMDQADAADRRRLEALERLRKDR
jgi:hypothetical protein